MRSWMIALISGIAVFWLTPEYWMISFPKNTSAWLIIILVIILFRYLQSLNSHFRVFFLSAIIGFVLAQQQQQTLRSYQKLIVDHKQTYLIKGTIKTEPFRHDNVVSFLIQLDSIATQKLHKIWPAAVRLSWYYPKAIPIKGERWQFRVKLKPLHGLRNPYNFDYERWAWSKSIIAKGYIDNKYQQQLLTHSANIINGWQRKISAQAVSPQFTNSALIKSLVLGDRSDLDKHTQQSLQHSGLAHLLAISGLHIGMVAFISFFLVNRLWKLSARLCLRLPSIDVAIVASVFSSTIFALISGFGLPVQRALLMLIIFALNQLLRIQWRLLDILLFTLCLMLFINPVSILDSSSWLSFGAVFIIIAVLRFQQQVRKIKTSYRINTLNWILFSALLWFGMLPLTLLIFGKIPLFGILANLIAIPLMSFLIMPLLLMGAMLLFVAPMLTMWLWSIADYAISMMLLWSELLSSGSWQFADSAKYSIIFILVVWLWLMPRALFPLKAAVMVTLLMSIGLYPGIDFLRYKAGARLTVFDVGQGLAVVWQETDNAQNVTTVLIDTAFGNDFYQAANSSWAPFFRAQGIDIIDILFVSHADSDHAGGVKVFNQEFSAKQRFSGQQLDSTIPILSCHKHPNVRINSTQFLSLQSFAANELSFQKNNNRSCVLQIKYQRATILLPGDIEAKVESRLLQQQLLQQVDVVVVPHHGSMTSSSLPFVAATNPAVAIFSSGYLNRYNFPRPEIPARYLKYGSKLFNTATDGAIVCDWDEQGLFEACKGLRDSDWGKWHWRQ